MKRPLIAHQTPDRTRTQLLETHSRNVGERCGAACQQIGLEHLGRLTGLLHDLGKAAHEVQDYLYGAPIVGKLNHSSAGMRWVWEAFGKNETRKSYRLAAQFAAIAIGCHHGTRCDIFAPEDGSEPWLERMYSEKADPFYAQSCETFFTECIPQEEIEQEMALAAKEMASLWNELLQIGDNRSNSVSFRMMLGLVQRYLFGALVDADWTDTAHFEENTPLPSAEATDWPALANTVEHFLADLKQTRTIDFLRQEISDQCRSAGQNAAPGIYRLYVPTGGGKTYSGLRFCIHAAEHTHASRIFYFAPYRSIIGQNTGHFRKALGNSALVLEHHADAIQDETLQESILAQTQNWQGVPLIATTMVQFLNTLFAAPRRNARRMPSLANAVLLFDEIQSLPLQHTYLFNIALNLLSQAMGCTIVLCTATQPPLEQLAYPLLFSTPKDIVPDYAKRFEQFKRTEIVPILDHSGFSAESLADFALDKLQTNDSLLVILNTRRMVEAVFDHLKPLLGSDVQLFCLTTHLCPQHRMDVIDAIKAHLDLPHPAQKLICVSTQLIEAGVDLSFDCVIRGMAGLPSVAQAAGRCNRHGQTSCRPVYLVPCAQNEEHLDSLPDLDEGRRSTERLLSSLPAHTDLLSPASIQAYYDAYYSEDRQKNQMLAPTGQDGQTLLDLLSDNKSGVKAYRETHRSAPPLSPVSLFQAFDTAESQFHALESDTISVIVPYREQGQKLVSLFLSTEHPGPELFREAQHYTVELNSSEFRRLDQAHAILPGAKGAVYLLQSNCYDSIKGIQTEPSAPEVLIF